MKLSASSGIESLDPAVRAAFDVPADQACKIYYLTDPQRPRQTKQKVHDAQSWQEFWSRLELCRGLLSLHLHVTPRAAPGSPEKEPSWLKIDTGVKRASQRPGGTPSSAAATTGATPSGSPGDVQTPRSPLLRDSTLHRDFDEEKDLSYCVFCGICYDAGPQLEAAHLIPNAVSERFDLAVSEDLLGMIGGSRRLLLPLVRTRWCGRLRWRLRWPTDVVVTLLADATIAVLVQLALATRQPSRAFLADRLACRVQPSGRTSTDQWGTYTATQSTQKSIDQRGSRWW